MDNNDREPGVGEKSVALESHTNLAWLGQVLWTSPPPDREHFKNRSLKKRPTQTVAIELNIPNGIIDGNFEPDYAEFIGVPVNALLSCGEKTSPGVWRVAPTELDQISMRVPEDFGDSVVHVTLKVAGAEKATGNKLTNMAAIRVEFPLLQKSDAMPIAAPETSVPADSGPVISTAKGEAGGLSGSSSTPGDVRIRTGKIVVYLGGGPEHGDPHYRILVDGRQIASGNIDWLMGVPTISDEAPRGNLCWQKIEIDWDFDDNIPDVISITYDADQTGQNQGPCLLSVDWIDVDGVRVLASGDYVEADGRRFPWPNEAMVWSWSGELKFDVAGAFAGVPSHHADNRTDANLITDERAENTDLPALVIHASDSDLSNPSVMSELAALGSYMRGGGNADPDNGQVSEYENLGLDPASWSDIEIVDEAENIILVNSDGSYQYEPSIESAVEEEKPERVAIEIKDAINTQQTFLHNAILRATEQVELTQSAGLSENDPVGQPETPDQVNSSVEQLEALKNVDEFYSQVLKRTLDKLETSIASGERSAHSPLGEPLQDVSSIQKKDRKLHELGERLKAKYLQNALLKTNEQLSARHDPKNR